MEFKKLEKELRTEKLTIFLIDKREENASLMKHFADEALFINFTTRNAINLELENLVSSPSLRSKNQSITLNYSISNLYKISDILARLEPINMKFVIVSDKNLFVTCNFYVFKKLTKNPITIYSRTEIPFINLLSVGYDGNSYDVINREVNNQGYEFTISELSAPEGI